MATKTLEERVTTLETTADRIERKLAEILKRLEKRTDGAER